MGRVKSSLRPEQARLGQVERAGHDDAHRRVPAVPARRQPRVVPPHLHSGMDGLHSSCDNAVPSSPTAGTKRCQALKKPGTFSALLLGEADTLMGT